MELRACRIAAQLRQLRDMGGQLRVQVGAKRVEGAAEWIINLGRVPVQRVGALESEGRKAWEAEVVSQVGNAILPVVWPYIDPSVPEEERGLMGCSLNHQGKEKANISLRAHKFPNRVVAQLADILSQDLEMPSPAGGGGQAITLRAVMGPGTEPEGCVTVTLKGPNLPIEQGAMAAILAGAGYDLDKVMVVQEFWGTGRVSHLADHNIIVAFVTAPTDDLFLSLLPDSIYGYGGSNAPIHIHVNSRRGMITSNPPPTPANRDTTPPPTGGAEPLPMEVDYPTNVESHTLTPPATNSPANDPNAGRYPPPPPLYPPPPPPRSTGPPPPPPPAPQPSFPPPPHMTVEGQRQEQPKRRQEGQQQLQLTQDQQQQRDEEQAKQQPKQQPRQQPKQQPKQHPKQQPQHQPKQQAVNQQQQQPTKKQTPKKQKTAHQPVAVVVVEPQQQAAPSPAIGAPSLQVASQVGHTHPPTRTKSSRSPPSPKAASDRSTAPSPPAFLGLLINWLEEKEVDRPTAQRLVGEWEQANKSLIYGDRFKDQMRTADDWCRIPRILQEAFSKFVEQKGVCMGSYGDSDEEGVSDPTPQQQERSQGSCMPAVSNDVIMLDAQQSHSRQHRTRRPPGAWFAVSGQVTKVVSSTNMPRARRNGLKDD
jgi:hypothetical protein